MPSLAGSEMRIRDRPQAITSRQEPPRATPETPKARLANQAGLRTRYSSVGGGGATGRFELLLGGAGEAVGGHVELDAVDVTVAEHLDELALADEPRRGELFVADLATVREDAGDVAHVHRLVLGAEAVLEATQLREPHEDGHLPTLEPGGHVHPGLGALRTATGRLALRTLTTAHANLVALGARSRTQVVDLDGRHALTSSTSTRWRTVWIRPRTWGVSF